MDISCILICGYRHCPNGNNIVAHLHPRWTSAAFQCVDIGTGPILHLPSAENGGSAGAAAFLPIGLSLLFIFITQLVDVLSSEAWDMEILKPPLRFLTKCLPVYFTLFSVSVSWLVFFLIFCVLHVSLLNSLTTKIFWNQNKIFFLHCVTQSHNVPSTSLNLHSAPR